MPKKLKNSTRKKKIKTFGIIDPGVGNYENHPFFVKKANEAREFIEKYGLPKEFKKKK